MQVMRRTWLVWTSQAIVFLMTVPVAIGVAISDLSVTMLERWSIASFLGGLWLFLAWGISRVSLTRINEAGVAVRGVFDWRPYSWSEIRAVRMRMFGSTVQEILFKTDTGWIALNMFYVRNGQQVLELISEKVARHGIDTGQANRT